MTRILLLPGLDGTDALFRPFVSACPPHRTVQTIEYDRVAATSYESLCDYVATLLPAEDFVLLGWSFSGPLALKLAARGFERLRAVILVTSFAWRPIRFLPRWAKVFARPGVLRLYSLASMGQALLYGYATPEIRALQREAFGRASSKILAARARMLMEVDARSELRTCPVPILYLRAAQDRVIHRSHGQMVVDEAPRATLVGVPGPHLCLATHPREAWTAIESSLAEMVKT